MATVTIRLIRSFEYRNIRCMALKDVDLDQSTTNFREIVDEGKNSAGFMSCHRTNIFIAQDCLVLYTQYCIFYFTMRAIVRFWNQKPILFCLSGIKQQWLIYK